MGGLSVCVVGVLGVVLSVYFFLYNVMTTIIDYYKCQSQLNNIYILSCFFVYKLYTCFILI